MSAPQRQQAKETFRCQHNCFSVFTSRPARNRHQNHRPVKCLREAPTAAAAASSTSAAAAVPAEWLGFKCPHCLQLTQTTSGMRRHMQSHHPVAAAAAEDDVAALDDGDGGGALDFGDGDDCADAASSHDIDLELMQLGNDSPSPEEVAEEEGDLPPPSPPSAAAEHDPPPVGLVAILVWLVAFLLAWAARHRLPESTVSELMHAIKRTLVWLHPEAPDVVNIFPANMAAAAKFKPLVKETMVNSYTSYAMCPDVDCGALYRLGGKSGGYARVLGSGAEAEWSAGALPPNCLAIKAQHPEQPRAWWPAGEAPDAQAPEPIDDGASEPIDDGGVADMEMYDAESAAAAAAPAAAASSARRSVRNRSARDPSLAAAAPAAPTPCGHRLTAQQRSNPNRPLLLFPYASVIVSLRRLLMRPDFEAACEEWRAQYHEGKRKDFHTVHDESSPIDSSIMADLWHGQRWEDEQFIHRDTHEPFKEPDADGRNGDSEEFRQALLAEPNMLALALNTDNYQPTKNGSYSVGAIYLTVLNLPREQRYLPQNCILVGLMPGHVSRAQQQSCFGPMVTELLHLFSGAEIETHSSSPAKRIVKAFLFMVVCDQPAARATSGHGSHAATFGCAYCDRAIPTRKGKAKTQQDYSMRGMQPLDQSGRLREPLTDALHREYALRWAAGGTSKERDNLFKSAGGSRGCRWAALLDLPYFRPMRGTPVDVMHNFDLGTVKSVMALLSKPTWRSCDENTEVGNKRRKRDESEEEKKNDEADDDDDAIDEVGDADVELAAEEEEDADESWQQQPATTSGDDTSGGEEAAELLALPRAAAAFSAPAAALHRLQRPLAAGEFPAVLTHHDLAALQDFMDRCICPSDIGRIPKKIASKMNSFKASEWSNWIGIFAVPALQEYMEVKEKKVEEEIKAKAGKNRKADRKQADWEAKKRAEIRFQQHHLNLLIRLRDISAVLRGYVITVADIEALHVQLVAVYEMVGDLFSDGAVKSNLHLHIHLRQMLLDYGPPAGWSCYAYERFNGLLAGVPMNYQYIEACTMRRFLLLLGAEANVRELIHRLRNHPPPAGSPGLADFEHILQMMNGASDSAVTQLEEGRDVLLQTAHTTASGLSSVRYKWSWTAGSVGDSGVSSYALFCKRRLGQAPFEAKGNEPYPGQMLSSPRLVHLDKTYPKDLRPNQDHLLNCLRTHYILQFEADIRALHKEGILPATEGPAATVALLGKHVYATLSIQMYHALHMGGELWGSAKSKRSVGNSYVAVQFFDDQTQTAYLSYGQVQFFFTHQWTARRPAEAAAAGVTYDTFHFAAIKWLKTGGRKNPGLIQQASQPLDIKDIIPVHRLYRRWIPCVQQTPAHVIPLYRPCLIPTKLHA